MMVSKYLWHYYINRLVDELLNASANNLLTLWISASYDAHGAMIARSGDDTRVD